MAKIRIVTDSSAQFLDPSVVVRYGIIVVPQTITFGAQRFRENIDLDTAHFFQLANSGLTPTLIAPSVEQFSDVYAALHRETDRILSIHISRAMSKTCDNAQQATGTLLGRCSITILDSMTTSIGLAKLVEYAAKLAETGDSLDGLARLIRKRVPHIYTVFYTDSFPYLERGGLVSESQSVLGAMLGIKPFLTIEEGELVTMEKVRTRAQAIDKLIEFVAEFETSDQLVILQNASTPSEQIRGLQERLATELNQTNCPVVTYNPSLGTYIGTDALGIIVYQDETGEM